MQNLAKNEPTRILVSDPVDSVLLDGLKSHGCDVDYRPDISQGEIGKIIKNYGCIVVRSRTKLSRELISSSNLRIIARAGIGTDNIDTAAAQGKNIMVVTAAGSSTQSVVELNIALMIDLARKVSLLNSKVKSGSYVKMQGIEVAGKTAGIIGFGRIGLETAKVLRSLGMKVVAYDIVEVPERIREIGGRYVSLKELLGESDFIFVLLTLGQEANRLIGEEELNLAKSGAYIVNTSRAEAVDPSALLSAIENGRISGYATDVLWNEPPANEIELKIVSSEKVIVTPHIGAQTSEAQRRVALVTLDNLLAALKGGV